MVEEATWLADIRALEGVKELSDPYWQHEDSIHGEDSMIAALHAGAEPMLRGVHMFFENTTKKVHSAWVLGSNVCSHPGAWLHTNIITRIHPIHADGCMSIAIISPCLSLLGCCHLIVLLRGCFDE